MYLAQRWLFGMVLGMWIGLCTVDIFIKNSATFQVKEFNKLNDLKAPSLKNSSIFKQQKSYKLQANKSLHASSSKTVLLQFMTFIAGAFLVLLYYRKSGFFSCTILRIKSINKYEMKKHMRKIQTLKISVKAIGVAILRFLNMSAGIYETVKFFLLNKYKHLTPRLDVQNVNLLLLNKLKENSYERENLGHVLFATIQENKNLRMQYQLETLAKKRLVKQIEDTQKQMKENRSRCVSFQQLYTIAHQENNFLRSRIKKITQDKEEAERNLIKLVNYVWQTKNNELKAYCSRLIVKTKNNLLNSDVKAEIDKFLKQTTTKSKQRLSEQESKKSHGLGTIKEVNENFHDQEVLTALAKDAPKLRGLPGECVWTVKDKDGFIEKLYEYETDYDSGDTIRRIRQYSVYYDKDCLLDVSSSATLIQNTTRNIDVSSMRNQYINKCITSSAAFQKFLFNNKIIVISRSSSPPQLTY